VRQLAGIGAERVQSLPDGAVQTLANYLADTVGADLEPEVPKSQLLMRIGDLCPDCGAPAVMAEERCRKCCS
jgi:ribonucleoside-diphosphate reductase alpha chain